MRVKKGTKNKEKLKNFLEKNYFFKIKSLNFIPKGADADSYIITAKSEDKFFVKVYDLEKIKRLNLRVHFESLKVLNKLHKEQNISKISYPILTKKNELYFNMKTNYRIVVSNFIEGKNDERQLNKIQLENFAKLMAEIHKSPKSLKKLIVHKETFDLSYLSDLIIILRKIVKKDYTKTPSQKKISKIILENHTIILDFIKKTITLSKQLNLSKKDEVITHSDPYFLNLMKARNEIYVIDWDGIKLGPKEQDIWFYLIKGICNKPFIFLYKYRESFGKFKLNKNMVHYYIQSRILEDFYHYLKEILSGKKDKIYFEEIKDYSLGWILKIEEMFRDVDKIIDKWNKLEEAHTSVSP